MSIYKLQRCPSCHYKRRHKKSGSCPKCPGDLYLSKNFYFDYYLHGRKHTKVAGPDRKLAIEAERKMKVDVSEGKVSAPTSWKESIAHIERTYRKLSPKTVEMYKNSLRHLSASFGRLKLSEITERHLEDYKDLRLSQVSGASFNRDRSTLKRLFALSGVPWRFKKNVFEGESEKSRDRFLDENEKARLMDACKKHDLLFTAILTALDTGLRKHSLLTLRWSDISFKKNIITKAGKGGKVHRIPMTGRLRDHLIEYRSRQKVLSMWVFPGVDIGKPITDIRKSFSTACREAGVPDIRFHDLRRTFGSWVIMTTKDVTLAQDLLGHADISTTRKVYGHLLDSHKRSGIQTYEEETNGIRT